MLAMLNAMISTLFLRDKYSQSLNEILSYVLEQYIHLASFLAH